MGVVGDYIQKMVHINRPAAQELYMLNIAHLIAEMPEDEMKRITKETKKELAKQKK